jgi:hypothetical protein
MLLTNLPVLYKLKSEIYELRQKINQTSLTSTNTYLTSSSRKVADQPTKQTAQGTWIKPVHTYSEFWELLLICLTCLFFGQLKMST